jgi:hypothetical protein
MPGALLIGGSAESKLATRVPVLWVEDGLQGGNFVRYTPLLPDGAVEGAVNAVGFVHVSPDLDMLWLTGTVALTSGNTIGMVWMTENLTDWTTTARPPLAGYANSLAGGGGGGGAGGDGGEGGTVDFGSSYTEGSDPLTSGRATMWYTDLFAVEHDLKSKTDLNNLVSGVPGGAQLTTVSGLEAAEDCNANCLLGTYVFTQPRASRDTLPHAAVLFSQPREAIPAVSAWGMVAMTLLVLTVGTVVYMRRRALATRW